MAGPAIRISARGVLVAVFITFYQQTIGVSIILLAEVKRFDKIFFMDEFGESLQTIQKMSPPLLLVLGVNVVIFAVKWFVPERLLMPIGVIAGGAVAPYLFSPGHLAYDVPSPSTALVIIGMIMGCFGVLTHNRVSNFLRTKGYRSGDTAWITRSASCGDQPTQHAKKS